MASASPHDILLQSTLFSDFYYVIFPSDSFFLVSDVFVSFLCFCFRFDLNLVDRVSGSCTGGSACNSFLTFSPSLAKTANFIIAAHFDQFSGGSRDAFYQKNGKLSGCLYPADSAMSYRRYDLFKESERIG